jgi:hypothetical protein
MLPAMPFGRRLRAWTLAACVGVVLSSPHRGRAEDASAANVAGARKHFEKARAFYSQGAYREAINELDAAHALDPNAKDLVFNLGVVHEKLADIDEALKWFRLYTTMDLVPQERDRADAYIRRLEGAKREIEDQQAAAAPSPPPALPTRPLTAPPENPTPAPPPVIPSPGLAPPLPTAPPSPTPTPPPPPPPSPAPQTVPPPPVPLGRIDALTLTAVGVSTGALAFAIIMGVKSREDAPAANRASGATISGPMLVDQLQGQLDTARREAAWADVGFGVALVSGVGATYLYFGRSQTTTAAPPPVSLAPISGGGTLLLKGRF